MSILGRAPVKKTGQVPPVRMWLYGRPDAGKTHFAKQFPNPLLLSTDGNYIYETIPANSIDAWEVGPLAKDEQKAGAFVNIIETLRTTNHGFETVILDLVDGAYKLAVAHYRKTLKIVHESDMQWGKGYSIITDNFIAAMDQLFKLPINVIITSHEDKETIKPKGRLEYTVLKPELNDKFHETIEGYCNLVARVYSDTDADGVTNRMLSLNPKEFEYGINRLGQADDLVLVHGGDNYADFYEVWKKMNETRDDMNAHLIKNTVRIQSEQAKAEAEKDEQLAELTRSKAIAEEKKAKLAAEKKAKIEAAKLAAEEEATKSEPVVEEAKIEEVAVEETGTKVIEEVKKEVKKPVKKVAEVKTDDIGDGEPSIIHTDETKAKMARIAALRAKMNKDKK